MGKPTHTVAADLLKVREKEARECYQAATYAGMEDPVVCILDFADPAAYRCAERLIRKKNAADRLANPDADPILVLSTRRDHAAAALKRLHIDASPIMQTLAPTRFSVFVMAGGESMFADLAINGPGQKLTDPVVFSGQ